MGRSSNRLVPQHVSHVAWLDRIAREAAQAFLAGQKQAGQLDAVASVMPELAALAAEFDVPFLTGGQALADLVAATKNRDWVLMVRDRPAPQFFHELMDECVFNPGVVYGRDLPEQSFRFFNLRASSLKYGGDLFDISAGYPARKVVSLKGERAADYKLSNLDMFVRRANKRIVWLKRKLDGQPVPRGPLGELKGNRIVG